MAEQRITKFLGIAPVYEGNLPAGYATIAENVDLSAGKIRPRPGHKRITTEGASVTDIILWDALWRYGDDRYFCPWRYDSIDLLFYLDSKTPKRRTPAEVDLGQDKPPAPTAALGGAGVLNATYQYLVLYKRTKNSYIDLSQPSNPTAEISPATQQVVITRGAISDTDVTDWWIFALSSDVGYWQFLAEVDAATATYTHNVADSELGESPLTYYTSDQGNLIVLTGPPVMSGLCQKMHYNMLFGWEGANLYGSEPNMPDGWDTTHFLTRFPSQIKGVFSIGTGLLVVLTQQGAFRISGYSPEILQPKNSLNMYPCVSGRGIEGPEGLYYPTKGGIAVFDGTSTKLFTEPEFDIDEFNGLVELQNYSHMNFHDNQLFYFHPGGTILCDFRSGDRVWSTLTSVFTASWVNPVDRRFYVSSDEGIYEPFKLPYFMPSDYLTYRWQSCDIDLGTGEKKRFSSVELLGAGVVTVSAYVDGNLVAGPKTIGNWDNPRSRTLKYRHNKGRATQVLVTGTGNVDEMLIRGSL